MRAMELANSVKQESLLKNNLIDRTMVKEEYEMNPDDFKSLWSRSAATSNKHTSLPEYMQPVEMPTKSSRAATAILTTSRPTKFVDTYRPMTSNVSSLLASSRSHGRLQSIGRKR